MKDSLKKYVSISNTNDLKKKEVTDWIDIALSNKKDQDLDIHELEHVLDYLLSDKSPNRLKKMSLDQAKTLSEKWSKSLQKKGKNIVETEEDVKIILQGKKSGMKYVQLIGESAFKREGALMSHCVANYYGKENCEVYSLRDINNNPHVTIEITKNGGINQIKGKGNGSIHPKYIKYVLKIFKYHNVSVRDSEMSNLGYDALPEEYLKLFEEAYGPNYKKVTYQGKIFVYRYQSLERDK